MLYMYFHVSGQFSFISWAIGILVGWDTLRFILEGIIVNNFSAQMILLVHSSDLILRTNVIWILKRLIFMSESSYLNIEKNLDEHVWGQFPET